MPVQLVYKELDDRRGFAYAWWQAMHTRVDIILIGHGEEHLRRVANQLETEFVRLEKIANYYDITSELHQVNLKAVLAPVAVSEELFDMVSDCIRYHQLTRGYFDVSIRSDGYKNFPAITTIELSAEQRTIYYKRQGVKIDLSGYLKGYALERARHLLSAGGITDALINLGNSSALAVGNHPYGQGWKVSTPAGKEDEALEARLFNECLTTSGNESEARKHIINPLTSAYVEGKHQVSVITPTGTEGEALATALFAAGNDYDNILAGFPQARILKQLLNPIN